MATGRLRATLEIGVDRDGRRVVFGWIMDAVSTSDGIVVLDGQARQVRRFDREGSYVRLLTDEGDGPGQIREARSLTRLSDSEVLVVEPRTGRAHHLTTSGAFVRTIDLGGEVESRVVRDSNGILYTRPEHLASWEPDGPVGRVPLLTVSPGRRVAVPLSVEPVGAGSVEARHPVQSPGTIRYRLDGVPVDTLPGPELTDRSVFLERPTARIYLFVPYQPRVVWGWTTHGVRYHGEADRPVLELVGLDGDVRSVVLPDERVPIPEDERDAIDGAIFYVAERNGAEVHGLSEVWRAKPVYRRVVPTEDGGLWLSRPVASAEVEPIDSLDVGWREPATDFVRLSADGTVDARVAGPPGIRVLFVQGDTVLARRVGELGVHSLVRYEIDWDSTIPKQ